MPSSAERHDARTTGAGVAVLLAVLRWGAVLGVVAGLVLATVFPDLLPGWDRRLELAGVLTLTAAPFLALLRIGLARELRETGAMWYALGALAVALIGGLLAR